ncbi:MAG TPA: hypothetical protein VF070_35530 [Streptosporangiaceae bacterium]
MTVELALAAGKAVAERAGRFYIYEGQEVRNRELFGNRIRVIASPEPEA